VNQFVPIRFILQLCAFPSRMREIHFFTFFSQLSPNAAGSNQNFALNSRIVRTQYSSRVLRMAGHL